MDTNYVVLKSGPSSSHHYHVVEGGGSKEGRYWRTLGSLGEH